MHDQTICPAPVSLEATKHLLMRKALFYLLLLGSSLRAGASTSITTAAVSGHWTLAGSPYYINNDVAVLPNTSLTIDPGVEVMFQGLYRMNVQGVLRAVGTAAQRISFKAFDTTGWHNDDIAAGGWRGIQLTTFASTGADTSAIEYCDVSDMKYGSASTIYPGYNTGCFFVERDRHMMIKHCNFFHNIAVTGYQRCIILYGPQTIDSCSIHDNRAGLEILGMSLAEPVLQHTSVYRNEARHTIAVEMLYLGEYHSARILDCDIYQNSSTSTIQGSQIHVNTGHALIKGCRIHHNINPDDGSIYCVGGQVEITNNLICNNKQTVPATCGAVEGGGAMHLCFNISTSSADSTSYMVRNNVIANNYSASGMGAGIYVWHANTWIMNNTIINNVGGGPNGVAIGLINFGSSTHIKNNVIFNNQTLGTPDYVPEVWILNGDSVEFENNWMQHPYAQTVSEGTYIMAGDTGTNIIAADLHLVNPTDSASFTESALSSDFALTALSTSCINKGDNTGCYPYATDHAGNPRIYGGTIDIGAYEYQAGVTMTNIVSIEDQLTIYPNPASDKINISLPAATGTLRIADVVGRSVHTSIVTTQSVSISTRDYLPGLYIVEWTAGNGQVMTKKIVVE